MRVIPAVIVTPRKLVPVKTGSGGLDSSRSERDGNDQIQFSSPPTVDVDSLPRGGKQINRVT
jgi:hypothetical protein